MYFFVAALLFIPCVCCAPVGEPADNGEIEPYGDLLNGNTEEKELGADIYLKDFGYDHGDHLKEGLKEFQIREHLNVTGEVDEDTIKTMKISRCGNPDGLNARSKRFYIRGLKWKKHDMTYMIVSSVVVSGGNFRNTIHKAFNIWSDVSPLTFTEVSSNADIDIYSKNIDGSLHILAQAYYPTKGDITFDFSEQWTLGKSNGINLLQVAVHEIGHAIGIGHSELINAVMHELYQGYKHNFELHMDDVAAAQAIYGKKNAA